MHDANAAWRELMKEGIEVSAGPVIDKIPPLSEAEEKSAGTMGIARRQEFAVGRAYAKCALSKFGMKDVELLVGEDRAPIWPNGFTGSITHTATPAGGHFAAAVAKCGAAVRRIGIDAEFIPAVQPQGWAEFLTRREIEFIRSIPVIARPETASAIWCAKEAACKAIGRSVEPASIETQPERTNFQRLETWRLDLMDGQEISPIFVRTAFISKLVLAVAILS